ncbi:ABC transporter permease [Streptomyces cupreus]|uniref:ABC transporter permease n=1 Tax=Streptomyces cupreus TaxID=2759956 RepID=A0A7X1MCV5_9ACTN|nr:ABC transporter permease [Streptomyces cupreus]MBC2904045.1 ABC transporter permease [Streptomyces cupreus]
MNTLIQPAPVAVRTEPRDSWASVFALARFESRRLLLSIPVLVAFAVHLAWIVWHTLDSYDGFPALQDADRDTQSPPMLVGLAVLLTVNLAVLRSRRRDTDRHFDVLVVTTWRRSAAHVLSVVPAALLTAVCVGVQFGWEALKPGAVGHGSPGELLVGPLTVLLFGTLGVLLARLLKSAFVGPLLVVFFLFFVVLGVAPGDTESGTRWLNPVVGESSSETLPSDLLGRPAAWHALYLLGLGLTAAVLAVLAGGGRRVRTLYAALGGAMALTLVGAIAQSGGEPASLTAAREKATVDPEQTCVQRGRSTYCAYPEWEPRVGTWAQVVDEVSDLAGGTAHGQRLLVRQRVEARYGLSGDGALQPSGTAHEVTVGTRWGGPRVPEFSSAVAAVLVAGNEQAGSELCDGRIVTVMWLALGWQDQPMDALRKVRLDDSVSGSAIVLQPTDPLSMSAAQTDVVRTLLTRPRGEATARVKEHWSELTAPGLTTARAAELLGVKGITEKDGCQE